VGEQVVFLIGVNATLMNILYMELLTALDERKPMGAVCKILLSPLSVSGNDGLTEQMAAERWKTKGCWSSTSVVRSLPTIRTAAGRGVGADPFLRDGSGGTETVKRG